jgi:ssDNA-binding replication factor A large subunit
MNISSETQAKEYIDSSILLIEGRIESIGESQTVNLRTGITAQVAHAIISDETRSIKLSLWDNQINSVRTSFASCFFSCS